MQPISSAKPGGGLGAVIREFRARVGMTQAELAQRIGTSEAYLSQIESGNRSWPQKYIEPLSRELGVSQIELAIAAGKISVEAPEPVALAS